MLYNIDSVVASVLRDGKRKDWIDLSPNERATEIEFEGCPAPDRAELRHRVWSTVRGVLIEMVEGA